MTAISNTDLFLNGHWQAAQGAKRFANLNPATGENYTDVADGSRDDATAAIDAAAAAGEYWRQLPHTERAGYLLRAADIITRRQEDFVNALVDEAGSWIGKAMFEAGYAPGVFRAAAAAVYRTTGEILPSETGKLSLVIRQPLGRNPMLRRTATCRGI